MMTSLHLQEAVSKFLQVAPDSFTHIPSFLTGQKDFGSEFDHSCQQFDLQYSTFIVDCSCVMHTMQPLLPVDHSLECVLTNDHTLWLIGCSCDYVESFPISYKISCSLLSD